MRINVEVRINRPGTLVRTWGTLSVADKQIWATQPTPPTPSSGVSLPYQAGFDTSYTGLPTSSTDPNSAQTVYKYNDPLLRLTEIDNPDGGKTTVSYTSPTSSGIAQTMNASESANTDTQLDGYGRLSRVATYNGNTNANLDWYQQDTCYDANGAVEFQSYTYQNGGFVASKVCLGSGDSYSYDALGRIKTVTHADGTSISYSYLGRATEVTDENGVIRISQVDGLGRTVAVCEISSNNSMPGSGSTTSCGLDIAGTGFLTTYGYDLANHKTTATQGAQTRVFQTDWLGRPTLIQEPESGQTIMSYAYNSTGLVVTRQRPKANQTSASTLTTTTQYDAISRVVSVGYSDGFTPSKSYHFDTTSGTNWSTASSATNLKGRWPIRLRVRGLRLPVLSSPMTPWAG